MGKNMVFFNVINLLTINYVVISSKIILKQKSLIQCLWKESSKKTTRRLAGRTPKK
jgi:hypothetical protein